MVFSFFGVQWVMPCGVIDLLACQQGWFGHHRNCEIWKAIPHCLMWCIWREWNARSFEGCEQTMVDEAIFVKDTI